MWASDRNGRLCPVGSRRYVLNHMLRDPVVPVTVAEVAGDDETGTHWGWVRAGKDEPEMIWPERAGLEMCFPYGSAIEVEHDKGRVVRLRVIRMESRG